MTGDTNPEGITMQSFSERLEATVEVGVVPDETQAIKVSAQEAISQVHTALEESGIEPVRISSDDPRRVWNLGIGLVLTEKGKLATLTEEQHNSDPVVVHEALGSVTHAATCTTVTTIGPKMPLPSTRFELATLEDVLLAGYVAVTTI